MDDETLVVVWNNEVVLVSDEDIDIVRLEETELTEESCDELLDDEDPPTVTFW